jgi:hypothetical protein
MWVFVPAPEGARAWCNRVMRRLVTCARCARHIDAGAEVCPFCATPNAAPSRPSRVVGSLTRAAVFAGVTACWTGHSSSPDPVLPNAQGSDTATASVVRGTLTRSDGAPAAGIAVTLAKLDGSSPVQSTRSDASGTYRFENVPPGRYQIVVDWRPRKKSGPPSQIIDVESRAPAVADFQLQTPPPFDPSQIPAPYGAPPARRRVV